MFNGLKSYELNFSTNNILDDLIEGLENWCLVFNDFFLVFCKYLKYIFVFIILFIGILTLLRLRGSFRQSRLMVTDKKEDSFTKIRLILGFSYIFLGIGILFNYLTYFLMWILEPLPDKLIYNFIDFNGINPFNMNGIKDISMSQYPHEKTIYYCYAFGSLISFLDILSSVWYLIISNRLIHNPNKALRALICGIFGCILFGFTTCLPFFL